MACSKCTSLFMDSYICQTRTLLLPFVSLFRMSLDSLRQIRQATSFPQTIPWITISPVMLFDSAFSHLSFSILYDVYITFRFTRYLLSAALSCFISVNQMHISSGASFPVHLWKLFHSHVLINVNDTKVFSNIIMLILNIRAEMQVIFGSIHIEYMQSLE